jgi:hypothetical protein
MVVAGTFTSSATDVDACVAGVAAEHAFAANIAGAGYAAEAGPLKAALAARPIASPAALQATLRSAGWVPSARAPIDFPYLSGRRTILAFAKKGGLDVTVHVIDFSPAVRGTKISLKKSAAHFLIVDGELADPGEGTAVAALLTVP